MLHFASFCNILLNFGRHNGGCKLPLSLPHEWLPEWKEQYIVETERKILFAQNTLLVKMHVKLCCILQVSAIYCSTLAAIMMAVSFLYHCHMSGWPSGKSSILQKLSKKSIIATPKGPCKAVLHFASFCNILLNFGSHNDGCKLLSSLPHEGLAEWKEQYIVETERKILFVQNTLLVKMHVKLCCILQVSAIYCSTLAAINDGCKLPSLLPHEWLAECKEQYIVETE